MNIQQAKDQIKQAVSAYFTRNVLGELQIPAECHAPTSFKSSGNMI